MCLPKASDRGQACPWSLLILIADSLCWERVDTSCDTGRCRDTRRSTGLPPAHRQSRSDSAPHTRRGIPGPAAAAIVSPGSLEAARTAYRLADVPADKTKSVVATYACDPARKIRLSKTAYEQGAIYCGVCEQAFTGDVEEG